MTSQHSQEEAQISMMAASVQGIDMVLSLHVNAYTNKYNEAMKAEAYQSYQSI